MKAVALAWSSLQRDWRSGELRLIALALLIAVTSITAVTMFIDRAFNAVEEQASTLLAADVAVESSTPVGKKYLDQARALKLQVAATLSFRSVISTGDKLQLTEVKAVDAHYPLRGQLETADRLFAPGTTGMMGPPPGTVWGDTQLFQTLQMQPGQSVTLGELPLPVSKVLLLEPDRGGDMFSIAPRVLMNLDDVPATKLILPGSRVTHRLLLAGTRERVREFEAWVNTQADPTVKLLTVRDARLEVRDALERAQQFLGLAALTSVVLSGIAIANAARRFAQRHLDTCAVMRCLGARQNLVMSIFLLELVYVYVLVSIAALALALVTQAVLAQLLAGLVAGSLPAVGYRPVLGGFVTGLIVLLGFALPPIMALRNVPPLRVLRRDLIGNTSTSMLAYGLAVGAICALAPWQIGQPRMTLYVLAGTLVTTLVLSLAAWVLVKFMSVFRDRVGVAWRYGLANISRRAWGSVVQVVGLGLGIMVMLVLGLVRTDLLQGWLQHLPPDANNQFLVNVQPGDVVEIQQFFTSQSMRAPQLHPMVRGRLVSINGKAVHPEYYDSPKARRLAERDFNLSWATSLQPDNRLTAGEWWTDGDNDSRRFSVEKGIAETLNIKLGDELTYQVAEQSVSARVVNLREVNWDTFNVNFFVIAPPGLLESYPSTFITSFYLPPERKSMLSTLVRKFPSITVVDVAAIMDHVRAIMDKVAVAAQFVFLFTMGAGLLVLIAAIQSTHDERLRETALLRSLGASNRTVAQSLLAEFVSLGLLAGLLAACSAVVLGYVLAHYVFKVDYVFNAWLVPIGVVVGAIGVGAVGLFGTRAVRRESPMTVLRRV